MYLMNPASHYRLMLVEDDMELAELICDYLRNYEFNVTHVSNGLEAANRIVEEQPDLVILDVMLPGQSGMDVCRAVRADYLGMILMQTALDDDIDQMMGLELGADDYIVKQVQPRLLLSRIRALLRRNQRISTSSDPSSIFEFGALKVDLQKRRVSLNNNEIRLTTAEFELLHLLAKNSGQVVSRDDIVQQIRGYEYDGLDRSIDRRISRLRRTLQDDPNKPQIIKTIRGKGYQLCPNKR
ncbi:winged helix-turn-helix domain-containing protein [Vibrio tapetis]|uniref:DNA-binding response regulator in two-component regulatory system with RstB n=1 Tax=Vibrio tapetis subsp. tapetis TaxID=1671868 RepID=A0A2N8ZJQ1_9VIBR|nr:winged helix-turn-helix domain-containing protein [Vibrio tapetis]SON52096.1 DNA-binding response regulator in two-component regulatory system with RstB [Vibrio tapetis subsp. tapetis]